ncbi:MAG: DUF1232 domain-containing protein [Planctomycetes bacterium]|nr:DUF1232 domain-containing protein [Planctomycetota bacterium]
MTWSDRARQLRDDAYALYLAGRDPRTPRAAKILIVCVVAYAASPIDLIPDFIPVLGLLDDLVLVPLGITLAIRMTPPEVWAEAREKARASMREGGPGGRTAAAIVVVVWLGLAALCAWVAVHLFR